MNLKAALRRQLQNQGWYVRKTVGLPIGIDLCGDLKKFRISPKCILDIGAHHGQTAISYAASFPDSRVFAFEPVSSNFAVLTKATAGTPAIIPINAAVGDQYAKLNIHLNLENSQASSFLWAPGDQSECVDIITVDDFCSERNVHPDFIKIDAEGFDLKVITGAEKTLATPTSKAVLVEATLNSYNKHCCQLAELTTALKPYGFRLVGIYDQTLWDETRQLEFFNALFVKRPINSSESSP